MAKIYTAHQMRDVAQCLYYNSPTKLTIEAADMLRQAAVALEREAKRDAKREITKLRRALDKFKCYDDDMSFEGVSHDSLRKCALCGCDAEVFDNTHFAAFCSNLNCDRSLAGDYSPCWRTNIVKAVNDWNEVNIRKVK